MRNIINLVFTFLVLWASSHYFGEYVHIQDNQTLILASIFMFVMALIFGLIMLVSIFLIPFGIGWITTIILILVACILTPIRLYLLDVYLPGFEIHGFWTYVILSLVLFFFSIKVETEQKQVNDQTI